MSDHIPMIYNYCDRWCERCRFVERCAVGEAEKDFKARGLSLAEALEENFTKIKMMLEEICRERGITKEDLAEHDKETEAQNSAKKTLRATLPLSKTTKQYIDYCQTRLKAIDHHTVVEHVEKQVLLGFIEETGAEAHLKEVIEAFTIIRQYFLMIHVKTLRALDGLIEEDDLHLKGFPKDHEGTTKLVTILAKRSMGAWHLLCEHGFYDLDDVLTPLALLEKVHNGLLALFPKAIHFIRPGFDE